MSQGVLQRFDAECRLHRDRDAPRQHATAEPVEHDSQVDVATRHRDIGDVHRPHLVRPRDVHAAQQIRIDLVAGLGLGRARTAIERFYPHPPHQRLHMPTADLAPLGRQKIAQHPRSREWELQMQPVETPHDRLVGLRHRPRQIVDAATADAQNLRLSRDRQLVLTVDHRFALSNPALVSAPSKKLITALRAPCGDRNGLALDYTRKGAAVTILVATRPR
jgi:hypothetical protein